jgi:exosortase A-associated hydrolase 2
VRVHQLEPRFLEGSAGRIFVVLRVPEGADRCVLFVPPFGEEMNKSRRQTTVTANALNEAGYASLVVDLFGTGDSHGSFADATWDIWKADVLNAIAWAEDHGLTVDALVATRLGCALAADSLKTVGHDVARTVFWQPIVSGRQMMTQFLRLRVAASMMDDVKESVDELKQRLAAGAILTVAGYQLSSALWREIEQVELASRMNRCLGCVKVLEIGRAGKAELTTAAQRLIDTARLQSIAISGRRLEGDPFWATTEIVINPELVQATVDHVTHA